MQVYDGTEKFKEVIFRTEPAGAKIYFDNSLIGFSSVSALMAEERKIKVAVENVGYEFFEKEFVISEINEKPYIIKLKSKEPAKGYFEISVLP
jgi:hypothetical protein